jgi:hypothetical protein
METKNNLSNIVNILKDIFSLLRDFLILLILICLILFPTKLNTILVNAGFKEGEIAGFKWHAADVINTNQTLQDAQTTNRILKNQVDSLSRLLVKLNPLIKDSALRNDIKSLEKNKANIDSIYEQTTLSVQTTLSANSQIVSDAQQQLNNGSQWGVVFSADLDFSKAVYERDVAAKKYEIPNVIIFFRQGYYRSVSVVNTKAEAQGVLLKAKKRRNDAYIILMSTWCPNANSGDGFTSCALK